MKNCITKIGVVILSLSVLFTSASALAGLSGNVTLDRKDSSSIFGATGERLSTDVSVTFGAPSSTLTVSAGLFRVKEGTTNYLAFCVELDQFLTLPTTYTVNNSLFSTGVVASLEKLFTNNVAAVIDNVTAAAFQVAIWEIVSGDASLNITAGEFILNTTGPVATKANEFLGNLGGFGNGFDLSFLAHTDKQDLVIFTERTEQVDVSAPATSVILMLGLGALFAASRRKA